VLDANRASIRCPIPHLFPVRSQRRRVAIKILDEYRRVAVPEPPRAPLAAAGATAAGSAAGFGASSGPVLMLTDIASSSSRASAAASGVVAGSVGGGAAARGGAGSASSTAIVASGAAAAVSDVAAALRARAAPKGVAAESMDEFKRAEELAEKAQASSRAIVARRQPAKIPEPKWHAPWKLMRVISGHLGWVRSIAVEPGNEWFVTGAADRTIKVWDLASGTLKLTLTGHINAIRALAVSPRHPYMFSAGEDKMVKCASAAAYTAREWMAVRAAYTLLGGS
jgi:WD40 repeat protein